MEEYNIVVLGAGLTGLSFAFHYDNKIPIFEKKSFAGGLVHTEDINGYKFDYGPHLFHMRSDYVKMLISNTLKVKMETYNRKAMIYYDEKLIPYPFELNLFSLNERIKSECLNGISEIDLNIRNDLKKLKSGSYKNYALKAFGRGISNHYLLPYNRKIWDMDPEDLTCEWMRFLPTADVEKIKRSVCQPNPDYKFGYNVLFQYPLDYGIQEVSDSFAKNLIDIRFNKEVCKIDFINKIIDFESGEKIKYRTLVSTLPLKYLIFRSNSDELKRSAKYLLNTCVYNINLVVKGMIPKGVHWIYFPGSEFEFYRTSFSKNYFPNCTPNDEQIISIEVSSRNYNFDIDRITNIVLKKISNLNIFKIEKILFIHSIIIPVAYCIYDKKRTEIVKNLRAQLDKLDVISVGRYGGWEYSGMEDAILTGRNLAERMKRSQ